VLLGPGSATLGVDVGPYELRPGAVAPLALKLWAMTYAKMRLNELAERIGITPQNLSVLKTGRARAIRFSTLDKLCEVLECQPGDLFAFEAETNAVDRPSARAAS
jgi:putative transcriptional regulator